MIRAAQAFSIAAILLAVIVLVVSGCGGVSSDIFSTYHVNRKHYNIDGRTYRCFLVTTSKGTATMTCDWDHPVGGA